MKRGPKGKSPDQLRIAGESRPSRQVAVLFPDHAARPDPESIPPPKGMTPAGKKTWIEKVGSYRRRGQKVDGFQDALRQYCELEAAINKAWKHTTPPMSMLNAYRLFAAEFYDTPASRKVSVSQSGKGNNRFARNGRRPPE